MAKRIEPFRDYSEHEVVNLYSLDVSNLANFSTLKSGAASGAHDAGVVVAVSNAVNAAVLPGDLPSDTALRASSADVFRKYLGSSPTSAYVGFNAYPINEMCVEAATTDADNGNAAATFGALGITLKETLAYDENDENLLRYPVKKDELQCVLPGQAVPILTRGMVLLNDDALDGAGAVGKGLDLNTDVAKVGLLKPVDTAGDCGKIIATNKAGDKWLCKLSF